MRERRSCGGRHSAKGVQGRGKACVLTSTRPDACYHNTTSSYGLGERRHLRKVESGKIIHRGFSSSSSSSSSTSIVSEIRLSRFGVPAGAPDCDRREERRRFMGSFATNRCAMSLLPFAFSSCAFWTTAANRPPPEGPLLLLLGPAWALVIDPPRVLVEADPRF